MTLPTLLAAAIVTLLAATSASAQGSPLDRYVRLGLDGNPGLAAERIASLQAEAAWAEGRAGYLPSLTLDARYSRADGGRTFDVPVGDLMNPVYSTLNGLLGDSRFPPISNQRFDLLRDREQDTRLRVTQMIWTPALGADVRSRRLRYDAAGAGEEAARRTLVRDIRVAYYRYANAARGVEILDAAVALVQENERVSIALRDASAATPDRVHRARAERLEVEAQRARAETERQLAGAWLNALVGRDPVDPVETSPADLRLPTDGPLGELRASASAGDEGWVEALAARSGSRRPEVAQLDHSVAAAEAGVDAARAASWPSLALAVDAGIQGRSYGFGVDHRYAMASLVVSWNVMRGGADRARARQAALEVDRLEAKREAVALQLRLELEEAARRAEVALVEVTAATERVREAEAAFRLVRRRQEEGLATALEFLDARATLTRAQFGQSIAETSALIGLAELDHAVGGRASTGGLGEGTR